MVRVFSFCLYNPPNPLYYTGLFENIVLIHKYFPTFLVYIYIGNDVPKQTCDDLRRYPNVRLYYTGETGAVNMIHRFFAIDEPGVDLMLVRDADSRIHWKDRWAIAEFLAHPYAKVHTIRDSPVHTAAIMGGLWGMKKIPDFSIRSMYDEYSSKVTVEDKWGVDQYFLQLALYPFIKPVLLIHSSNGWTCEPSEHIVMFPFKYSNDVFCGRNEYGPYSDPPPPPIFRSVLSVIHAPR
jgi:hypothetical protein